MSYESYSRSSKYYDLIHEFLDFPAVARRIRNLIDELRPGAGSVLEVACGTGIHLELLGGEFERVGVDLSEGMLDVARQRCPDVQFHQQDMVDLHLGRSFDVVMCLFSSIGYAATVDRLDRAVAAMADHLAPGGVLLVEPWFTPERFWDGHLTVNHARSDDVTVTWMYRQERHDRMSLLPIHYVVGDSRGVEHWVERHEMGLFTDDEYRTAFTRAGMAVEHRDGGPLGRGVYIGHGATLAG